MCMEKRTDRLYHGEYYYAFNEKGERLKLAAPLESVCACESSYPGGREVPRHYEKDGETVRYGRITPGDTGMCQINVPIHKANIKEMGLNVHTPYGNIAYANYLYEKHGEQPWQASGQCH